MHNYIQNIVLEFFFFRVCYVFGGGVEFLIGIFLINTNGRKTQAHLFIMRLNIVLSRTCIDYRSRYMENKILI